MNSEPFDIKRGDISPPLEVRLLQADGQPAALDGATVRLVMTYNNDVIINFADMEIVDPETALCRYAWQVGDTDLAAVCTAECKVTLANGRNLTFPNNGFIPIRIHKDLR